MNLLRKLSAIFLSMALMLSFAACGSKNNDEAKEPNEESVGENIEENNETNEDEEKELEKVTFVLDWTPNTNHTGLYVAMAKGYFEEAGIEVEVVQPPEDGAEVLVASGRAQFGVSFQDYIAPALVGEEPLGITAVAAILQHNTSGIISRKGEGMDTPKGLEGHKYATWDLPVEKETIRQVMDADGGNFDNVELIPSTVTDEVSALESKSVDAIWIFYGWAGVACNLAGLETDYFAFADIDPVFDFYTPVIIANNDYLENKPELAKAFMEALSKGYKDAVEDPEGAAKILIEAAPELQGSEDLVIESQKYLAEQYIADAARWGEFDAARWSGFYNWLNEKNLLEGEIDPNAGFTNDFLPEA